MELSRCIAILLNTFTLIYFERSNYKFKNKLINYLFKLNVLGLISWSYYFQYYLLMFAPLNSNECHCILDVHVLVVLCIIYTMVLQIRSDRSNSQSAQKKPNQSSCSTIKISDSTDKNKNKTFSILWLLSSTRFIKWINMHTYNYRNN